MIAVFDIQHFGQPGANIDSRGAWADLDGDGQRDSWEHEAALTPFYAAAASQLLAAAGVPVAFLPWSFSTYEDRAKQVIELQARANERIAVIQCHLNAGAGDYALTLYHNTRPSDRALAQLIADNFGKLPEIAAGKCFAAQPSPHWTHRARYCLEGYEGAPDEITAVLVEPWFLDTPSHQSLAGGDGPQRVGSAIASAILAWR